MSADGGVMLRGLVLREVDNSLELIPQQAPRRWRGESVLPAWLRRSVLLLAVPLALVTGWIWVLSGGGASMSTDNANIKADKVGVSTDVARIVRTIDVTNNQAVAGGQILFRLDDEPYRIALAEAEAKLGTVRDDLTAGQAHRCDLQAQIVLAQDNVAFADREYQRQRGLATAAVRFDKTQLATVQPCQPARITVDAYPGTEWQGAVKILSPAAAQVFALLPPENTGGTWVKVAHRFPAGYASKLGRGRLRCALA